MKVKILAFGISKDIFGNASINLEIMDNSTVDNLKRTLEDIYPRLSKLASFMVAINNKYGLPGEIISEKDEIAIIPPVSGG